MYKDDIEEEISQSDAEPVMTMNKPVRNADDVRGARLCRGADQLQEQLRQHQRSHDECDCSSR